jgi:parallel beta-helix repeat protein
MPPSNLCAAVATHPPHVQGSRELGRLLAPYVLAGLVSFLPTGLIDAGVPPRETGADSVTFYVAGHGSDSWSGTLFTPNSGRTDGPFATLERARAAVRAGLRHGLHPSVYIRGGVYRREGTLLLDSADGGSEHRPVVWAAYPGDATRITGGRSIGGFQPVRDPAVARRLRNRDSILVTDLRGQGITDFGIPPNRINLFFKGKRMSVARYPNSGWLTIADVPQVEGHFIHQGDKKVMKDGIPSGRHSGMFRYDGHRPSGWLDSPDIWMHGYWAWDWRDAYQKVARIDTAARLVYPEPPHHHYGYRPGQRYSFLNVLEELDTPGEWALDETRGLLYFWPPSSPGPGDAIVSLLKEPMILLDRTSHVRIEGLILECSRACAVKIRGGTGNMVAGCTVRNIDNDTSLIVAGGSRNGVRSCDVYDVGSTGISISGGDRQTLLPAGNYAINNHIYSYGRVLQTFNGGVFLEGVGNIVSHNRIHDSPFSGIQYYGNDHQIEFNDLYDLAHESGDVGGINTGGDYSDMGTRIRYNYIHDSHGYGDGGFRGIYLDLPGSNTTIYGNILANVDIGIFFNSGRDNVVANNIFVNCHPAVNIYIWPHRAYFYPGGAWKLVEKLHAVRYTEPPYSVRYPLLPRYLDTTDLGMPYGHRVTNNLSIGGTWLDLSEGMTFGQVQVEKNVIADSVILVYTRKWTPDYDPYHIGYASTHTRTDTVVVRELTGRGNTFADPLLRDARRGDFRPDERSPAWKTGFQAIPFETIGLMRDDYRRTPVR